MQYWLKIIFMRIREKDTFVVRETEMIFDNFSYIKTETLSGDIRTDIKNFLFINGKDNTYKAQGEIPSIENQKLCMIPEMESENG